MNMRSNRLDVLAVGAQTSSTIPQSSGRIFPVFLAQPEVVSLSVAQQCTVALVEEVFFCSLTLFCSVQFGISQVWGVTAAAVNMSVPSSLMKQPPIQSTAGAVPVRNEKGTVLSGFPVGSYLFPQHIPNLPRAHHLNPSDPYDLAPYFFDFPYQTRIQSRCLGETKATSVPSCY